MNIRIILCVIVMVGLTGCLLTTVEKQGYVLSPERLEKIEIGTATKRVVEHHLGTPTFRTEYEAERWHYVSSAKAVTSVLNPELVEQDVITIEFDEQDVVSKVEHKTADDSAAVNMVNRKTKTEGHSISLVEQLIGNFGRFNNNAADAAQ